MLDLRAPLIPACAAVGVVLGATAWLVAGRMDVLAPLQTRLDALAPARKADSVSQGLPILNGSPLFALSAGPGAVSDPPVAVLGLSRMPGRSAVLLAIGSKPPAWMAQGESSDGVIVREIEGGRAVLDLPLGLRTLRVGENAGAALPSGIAGAAPGALPPFAPDGPPPGFRSPPPPASAPGMGR